MDWRERISVDPQVCHGKACIRVPLTGRLWVVTERDVRIRGGEEEPTENL
jgi:hypothetical protein